MNTFIKTLFVDRQHQKVLDHQALTNRIWDLEMAHEDLATEPDDDGSSTESECYDEVLQELAQEESNAEQNERSVSTRFLKSRC
ncbi:unnamed protein product [Phytophthora fragariaefolia]|uniref:Unnamed protein product n=1 Tax=Phytophthora fragariaefolia TaxID=1490495 RepID=A0A9W6XAP2_9STRA|nr:unnamed protein product [Phytophthora fragariaefolia]